MDETDSYVGGRIRQRRETLGITQRQLAKALGTSYQQLQKYERGRNQIPASRLFALTAILNVSATYFFGVQAIASQTQGTGDDSIAEHPDTRRLAAAFVRLRNKALRRSLITFIEAVADQQQWPTR